MNLTNDNIIHTTGENIDYIQFRRLLEYKDIINHAYTLRNKDIYFGPNLEQDKYKENYNYLCKELNLNSNNIIKPEQKHTINIKIINNLEINPEINSDRLKETDALITNKKNIILSSTNADCILF